MMELKIISDSEYCQYLNSKQNVSLQMQMPMVEVYRLNGWTCKPVGLFTSDQALKATEVLNDDNHGQESNQLVGVAMLSGKPLKFSGMYYTCQYGPHLDSDDSELVDAFFKLVLPILKSLNCSKFSCNPNVVANIYNLDGEIITENAVFDKEILFKHGYTQKDLALDTNGKIDMRYMFKKDLNFANVDELRASYKARTRRELNNAINNQVEITELDFSDIQQFTDLMNMSGEKHGYRVHGSDYYESLKKQFGDNALFLVSTVNCAQFINEMDTQLNANNELIASYDNNNRKGRITKLEEVNSRIEKMKLLISDCEPDQQIYLTAGVYIKTNDQLIHFLSGNDAKYGKFNGSTLMQDYAMQYAINADLPVFNMYGISGTFESSDSVYNFKVGFGGYVEEYIGTFEYQLAPTKLKIAEFIKKIIGH